MALFNYTAFHSNKKKKLGYLLVESQEAALQQLAESGLYVSRIEVMKSVSSREFLCRKFLIPFSLQLSSLLDAGLPLYQSLILLQSLHLNEKVYPFLLYLSEKIKEGHSFTAVLKEDSSATEPLYIALVENGERVGKLGQSLEKAAKYLEKQESFYHKIKQALTYPLILFSMTSLVVLVLLLFVVPSMAELFSLEKLNILSKTVFSLSMFISARGGILLLGIVFLVGSLLFLMGRKRLRRLVDEGCLRIPLLRRLRMQIVYQQFAGNLSHLLLGGVTLVEALAICKNLFKDTRFREILESISSEILKGKQLSECLSECNFFPLLFVQMVRIGEEGGTLETMLSELSSFYEKQVDETLGIVLQWIQPILLLFLGFLIGLILLAILLPFSDMNALAM